MSVSMRQHPRDREHAGDQTRRRGDQCKCHRQVEAGLSERGLGRLGQRVVLCRDDAVERQAGADCEGDKKIDDHADRNGQDNGPAHVLMWLGDLGTAVCDRGEALEGQDR
jgi:hypothetical protein